jgi:hypothetical protein
MTSSRHELRRDQTGEYINLRGTLSGGPKFTLRSRSQVQVVYK